MEITTLPLVLSQEDKKSLALIFRRPLNANDKKLIAFYLRRGYSLKEIAQLYVQARTATSK